MRSVLIAIVVLASLSPAHAAPQSSSAIAPQEGRVLFVGSSIIRRWTNLARQMDPLPVTNRGFDGFQTRDVLNLVDRVVIPSRPRVIVYQCGSNDIDTGEPPAAIVSHVQEFVARVAAALPATRIIILSINRAPQQQDAWDAIDAVNRDLQTHAMHTRNVQYVDVNPALVNPDRTPRLELFQPDERHLKPAAYEGYARILKPVLITAFEAAR